MSRVITFSTRFQSNHPRKKQRTYFVEAIYKNMFIAKTVPEELVHEYSYEKYMNGYSKGHTVRDGKRWKVGDKFSPRIWGDDINPRSGRSGPYHSKQIILSRDVEIVSIWNFEFNGMYFMIDGRILNIHEVTKLANNDGLSYDDFVSWFKKPMEGQIICWDKKINY